MFQSRPTSHRVICRTLAVDPLLPTQPAKKAIVDKDNISHLSKPSKTKQPQEDKQVTFSKIYHLFFLNF